MAKRFPLDLSKFKKVSQDENTSTLQHPDGHNITIAHGALSSPMRKQLDELPLMNADNENMIQPNSSEQPSQDDLSDVIGNSPRQDEPEKPMLQRFGRGAGEALGSAMQNTAGAFGQLGNQLITPVKQIGAGIMDAANAADPEGAPVDNQARVGGSGNFPLNAPEQKQPQDQRPMTSNALYPGVGQQLRGIEEQRQAEQASGAAQSLAANAQVQALQQQQDEYKANYADLTAKRQHLIDDMSAGHFDPNHYINNMTGGQKIGTMIGLLLGGLGAGPNGVNPAMEIFKQQIDRDIEAQKQEFGKKKTLLEANFQQTGDMNKAMALTRANLADMFAAKIDQAKLSTSDLQAKARADKAKGQLLQETAQPALQMGAMSKMMSGQQVNPEFLPKDIRERAVNVGGQHYTAPTTADAEKSRTALASLGNIKNTIQKMQESMATNGRTFNPWGSAAKSNKIYTDALRLESGKLHGINRLTENELKIFTEDAANPGGLNQIGNAASLKAMSEITDRAIQDELVNHLQGYKAPKSLNVTPNRNASGYGRR